jgi:hypothetical protein
MRRIQFVELHEQAWLPSSIRDEITDALQFGLNLFKAYAPVAPLLQSALDSTGSQSVVDLCSGGGGPWRELSRQFWNSGRTLHVWLTDKYPNLTISENLGASSENRMTYYQRLVDATNVPLELKGFRTMFTSFHHFSPDEARAILQNAVDAGEGIGIFEITRRAPATIGLMFAWALILFGCKVWVHPFRWSRLFWTYIVPVIPVVLLFDGVVSCLRTYSLRELHEIVETLGTNEYQWEIGEDASGKVPITYLMGYPRLTFRVKPTLTSIVTA